MKVSCEQRFTNHKRRHLGALHETQWRQARALRSILEDVMLDLMYEVPALEGVKAIMITDEVINGTGEPQILT